MTRYILGLNAIYHDPAACLLGNGQILAAVEEERFNRIKHSKCRTLFERLPIHSIEYCLKEGGITFDDIEAVGFSIDPDIPCQFITQNPWNTFFYGYLQRNSVKKVPCYMKEAYHWDVTDKWHWVEHHLCHASSAYFVSPFQEAAVLTIDGIGECCSTWLGYGNKHSLNEIRQISYPQSIGFLWEVVSEYLGYTKVDAAKIMGLASYGDPTRYLPQFQKVVSIQEDDFRVEKSLFKGYAIPNQTPFTFFKYHALEALFGERRRPTQPLEQKHYDLAAALQELTNKIIINLCYYLKKETRSKNLVLAGGVALNCVTNELILQRSGFDHVFIQPGAHDAGTALGAAFYLWNHILGKDKNFVLYHPFLGPEFSVEDIKKTMDNASVSFQQYKKIEPVAAKLLSEGNILGWFQGRMEFGPRALGHRSILASPLDTKIVQRLNIGIKKREWFRPYAPAVPIENYKSFFQIDNPMLSHQFMLFVAKVNNPAAIPAVVHINGTSRVQLVEKDANPKFHSLLTEFGKITGIPVLLNTSFNRRGEPIVCTPQHALAMFLGTDLDFLVLDNILVSKIIQ
jgi:carbamoyltransferase